MPHHSLDYCLCCESSRLVTVLDLGSQPPANHYISDTEPPPAQFPLALMLCQECWHSQLSYCVDRESIFGKYAYLSGTSNTLRRYFTWFAKALQQVMPPSAKVLELAANDGSLLGELQLQGFSCLGIDPASNVVVAAQQEGLPVRQGYWPEAAADLDEQFEAIICMNVLAHVDEPLAFLRACTKRLSPTGRLLIQPSQARMFDHGEFDTVYHEHLSFFNTQSMTRLAQRAGLKLAESFLVAIHGDSPVYVLMRADAPPIAPITPAFSNGEFAIAETLENYESRVALYEPGIYARFSQTARQTVESLKAIVSLHRQNGFAIVFVGAAAKAMTVLNAAQVQPDLLLDESPLKIGLLAPGCGIRIDPLSSVEQLTQPALFIISAWNFRHELTMKLKAMRIPAESKFYAYFPKNHFL